MRKIKLLFIFFLLHSRSFSQDFVRVKKNLDTLCSPQMHGRGATFNGDKIAAEYLQIRFKKIGLHPFNENYFQNFNYNINTFPGTVFLQLDGNRITTGQDYILDPACPAASGKAKLLFLDTLIFSNEEKMKIFLKTNIRKKALVYNPRSTILTKSKSAEFQNKLAEAKCIVELQEKKLIASLSDHQLGKPSFEIKESVLKGKNQKIKYKVDATLIKNYQSQNVLGFVKGKTHPDTCIIISAHYDHLGRMGRDTYFPGANDNASGVSMLLELAQHYSENIPDYTIIFIAFSAEEAGLIGSKFYTDHPLFPLEKTKFVINLDLLGTGDEGMMVVNGAVFSKEFEMLTKINESKNYLPAIKKRGRAANSDHYFFSEKGIPAFFFYTLGGITAYHDIYDKPETLPLTKFSGVYKLILEFVDSIQ